jgi:predicted HicB family RNase H-like nuclease
VPTKKIKAFLVRMEYDLWKYLRRMALDQECSMNELINKTMRKMQENREKVLRSNDPMI